MVVVAVVAVVVMVVPVRVRVIVVLCVALVGVVAAMVVVGVAGVVTEDSLYFHLKVLTSISIACTLGLENKTFFIMERLDL